MTSVNLEQINAIPMLQTLGIRCTATGADFTRMEVTVSDAHRNFYGGAHGGLLATLVDTACFFADPLAPAGRRLTTSQLSISYLRPVAAGDHLIATSQILHLGRRTIHLDVSILNQHGKQVVHGTATLLDLEPA